MMKKNIEQQNALNESRKLLQHLIQSGASDIEIMKARLKTVVHDKDLQNANSG